MKSLVYIFSLLMIGSISHGQTARVVGYLPTYRFNTSAQIEYCKLTHLNLAFANPDSAGNLQIPDYTTVVSDALSDNPAIIICISLGGAGLTSAQKSAWSNFIDIPSNRPAFISSIVEYVLANQLDGVDMDLEWDDVTSGYSDFITELDTALNTHDKLLTVAFPNHTLYSHVSREALDAFDFINIMAYDATGPWNPSSPGQHSSLNFSSKCINFWKNTAGVSGNKLTLGVPFYGDDFVSPSLANAVTYAQMVNSNPSYADLDTVGNIYYNGRPSIESKVILANSEVSGIMIWEIGQDSFDEYSLLTTIHNKYTSLGITTTGLCGNENALSGIEPECHKHCKIYPNPAHGFLTIKDPAKEPSKIIITNSSGQFINIDAISNHTDEWHIDVSKFQKGLYFIKIVSKDDVLEIHKIMVI